MRILVSKKSYWAAWLGAWIFLLMPVLAQGVQETWIDQITQVTQYHQELAKFQGKEQAYVPYLVQIEKVRIALNSGDQRKIYVAMNRLMDMLEADANGRGGIPQWSAKMIFDFCGLVTPPIYHDVSRHLPRL